MMDKVRIGFEFEFGHWIADREALRRRLSNDLGLNFDVPFTVLKGDPSIHTGTAGRHELTTPPEPFEKGIDTLHRVFAWMRDNGATTNYSTGLHMGMSVDGIVLNDHLKHLKMSVLADEIQLLQAFNRLHNSYCPSALARYFDRAPEESRADTLEKSIVPFWKWWCRYDTASNALNFKNMSHLNYMEVRAMGGDDYHNRDALVESWIRRLGSALEAGLSDTMDNDIAEEKFQKLRSGVLYNA